MISKGIVAKGKIHPQKVHELLPLFAQYDLDHFRPNLNNMYKKHAAGTLTYNQSKIPDNVMVMINDGKLGGHRSKKTEDDLNQAFEGNHLS